MSVREDTFDHIGAAKHFLDLAQRATRAADEEQLVAKAHAHAAVATAQGIDKLVELLLDEGRGIHVWGNVDSRNVQ